MKVSELMRALGKLDPDTEVLWFSDSAEEMFAAGIKTYPALGSAVVIDRADESDSEGEQGPAMNNSESPPRTKLLRPWNWWR